MNREIEFRGKRKDNEEWVYGDLYQEKKPFSKTKEIIEVKIVEHRPDLCLVSGAPDNNHWWRDVIPETVGRLIGKKDIKDIPIYEGDIFKFKFMEELNKPIELIGSFVWNDEDLSYEIDIYSNEHPEYVCLHYAGNGQMYDFEIIGNIFDNAELLNK